MKQGKLHARPVRSKLRAAPHFTQFSSDEGLGFELENLPLVSNACRSRWSRFGPRDVFDLFAVGQEGPKFLGAHFCIQRKYLIEDAVELAEAIEI